MRKGGHRPVLLRPPAGQARSLAERLDFDRLDLAFSTALSTVGNIGPGFGAIGPAENYAHYPVGVKLFLSLAMLTGRLELYSVVVLLTPAFWRK